MDVPGEAMSLSLGMVRGRGIVPSVLSQPEFSTLSHMLEGAQVKLGSSGGPEGRKAEAAELGGCASAGAGPPGQSGVCHQGITGRRPSGKGFELSVPNRSPPLVPLATKCHSRGSGAD